MTIIEVRCWGMIGLDWIGLEDGAQVQRGLVRAACWGSRMAKRTGSGEEFLRQSSEVRFSVGRKIFHVCSGEKFRLCDLMTFGLEEGSFVSIILDL